MPMYDLFSILTIGEDGSRAHSTLRLLQIIVALYLLNDTRNTRTIGTQLRHTIQHADVATLLKQSYSQHFIAFVIEKVLRAREQSIPSRHQKEGFNS